MTIQSITLTGVEETTDLYRLEKIAHPWRDVFVEWGVLYSPERAGKDDRYPSLPWIRAFSRFAYENRLNTAIHVCGRGVDELLGQCAKTLRLTEGFGRIQLNFNQERRKFSALELDVLIRRLRRPVITQYNDANASLSHLITAPNHQLLVDSSSGRGIAPLSWPVSFAKKATGYAGGLGPDNLADELPKIATAAGCWVHRSWVDMESKLRTPEGSFDLRCAERAIDILRVVVASTTPDLETPQPSATI